MDVFARLAVVRMGGFFVCLLEREATVLDCRGEAAYQFAVERPWIVAAAIKHRVVFSFGVGDWLSISKKSEFDVGKTSAQVCGRASTQEF
jgi:hypothetical protein